MGIFDKSNYIVNTGIIEQFFQCTTNRNARDQCSDTSRQWSLISGEMVTVKSLANHAAHSAALISGSSVISQTPVEAAKPWTRGQCVARCACLLPSLRWY